MMPGKKRDKAMADAMRGLLHVNQELVTKVEQLGTQAALRDGVIAGMLASLGPTCASQVLLTQLVRALMSTLLAAGVVLEAEIDAALAAIRAETPPPAEPEKT